MSVGATLPFKAKHHSTAFWAHDSLGGGGAKITSGETGGIEEAERLTLRSATPRGPGLDDVHTAREFANPPYSWSSMLLSRSPCLISPLKCAGPPFTSRLTNRSSAETWSQGDCHSDRVFEKRCMEVCMQCMHACMHVCMRPTHCRSPLQTRFRRPRVDHRSHSMPARVRLRAATQIRSLSSCRNNNVGSLFEFGGAAEYGCCLRCCMSIGAAARDSAVRGLQTSNDRRVEAMVERRDGHGSVSHPEYSCRASPALFSSCEHVTVGASVGT